MFSFMHLLRFISSPTYHSSNLGDTLVCYCSTIATVNPECVCVCVWACSFIDSTCVFFYVSCCFMFLRVLFCFKIRKLRRELDASQEKVSALTTQLSANVSWWEWEDTHTFPHTLLSPSLCNHWWFSSFEWFMLCGKDTLEWVSFYKDMTEEQMRRRKTYAE